MTEKVARGFVSRLFEWSGALVGRKLSLIFVVDDEKIIATTLAAILSQSGFRAEAFTNPLDALKKAHTEAPDLLLSDVVMPEMSGIDFLVRVRSEQNMVPFGFITSENSTSMRDLAMNSGATFLICKPFSPEDVQDALSPILGRC